MNLGSSCVPDDNFSAENGIIVVRATRWPLAVDPQGQALIWISRLEESNGIQVCTMVTGLQRYPGNWIKNETLNFKGKSIERGLLRKTFTELINRKNQIHVIIFELYFN